MSHTLLEKTTREHYLKYEDLIRSNASLAKAVVDQAKKIWSQYDNQEWTDESLSDAVNKDHLNFTNGASFFVYDQYYSTNLRLVANKNTFFKSDNLCLIKHAIIYYVLGFEPDFSLDLKSTFQK